MNNIENTLENFNELNNSYLSYPFSLLMLNIRSMRTNFNALLLSIHGTINKIKLIVIVETNLTDEESPFYAIDGFTSMFINRGSRGEGIHIFIKNSITFSKISTNTASFESLQINLQLAENITILAVYRPPSLNVNAFIKELNDLLKTTNKDNIILTGDINIDILKNNYAETTLQEH